MICYRRMFPNPREFLLGLVMLVLVDIPVDWATGESKYISNKYKMNCFTFTSDHSVYICIRLDT